jgi:hypothetical protein
VATRANVPGLSSRPREHYGGLGNGFSRWRTTSPVNELSGYARSMILASFLAQSAAPNGWQAFHALGTDMTYTNPAGAAAEAGFVVELIRQANLTALVNRLR